MTSQSQQLIDALIAEERVVVSQWRTLILLRRAAREMPRAARSWAMPRTTTDIAPLLRQMEQRDELSPIEGHRGIFQLTASGARSPWVDEQELLLELMPYATLSHRSAMIMHNLTTLRTVDFVVTTARERPVDLVPAGTEASEWRGLRLPRAGHVETVLGQQVRIRKVTPEHFFGYADVDFWGIPLRITTVERTLVDGLLTPNLCDGIDSVLGGWALARYDPDFDLDINQVVNLVDRYDIGVLRQRVGFVLEQLGIVHPRLGEWQTQSQRGGSSRLVPNAPFTGAIDSRWNLSLNGPTGALDWAA